MMAVRHPESPAAVVNCCKQSSKTSPPVKFSDTKQDGTAEVTVPAAAVDVLGSAGVIRVRDTETPLPEPDPNLPPPPLRGDALLDSGVDEDILKLQRR